MALHIDTTPHSSPGDMASLTPAQPSRAGQSRYTFALSCRSEAHSGSQHTKQSMEGEDRGKSAAQPTALPFAVEATGSHPQPMDGDVSSDFSAPAAPTASAVREHRTRLRQTSAQQQRIQPPRLPKDFKVLDRESQLEVLRWLQKLMNNAGFRKNNGICRKRQCPNCSRDANTECALLHFDDIYNVLQKQQGKCQSCHRLLTLGALGALNAPGASVMSERGKTDPDALRVVAIDRQACRTAKNFLLRCAGCAALHEICFSSDDLFERWRQILFNKRTVPVKHFADLTNVKVINSSVFGGVRALRQQFARQLGFCVYPRPRMRPSAAASATGRLPGDNGNAAHDRDAAGAASSAITHSPSATERVDEKEPGASAAQQSNGGAAAPQHHDRIHSSSITFEDFEDNDLPYSGRKRKRGSDAEEHGVYADDPRFVTFLVPLDARPCGRGGKNLSFVVPVSSTLNRSSPSHANYLLTTVVLFELEQRFGFPAFMRWAMRRLNSNWHEPPKFVAPNVASICSGLLAESPYPQQQQPPFPLRVDRECIRKSGLRPFEMNDTAQKELAELRDVLMRLQDKPKPAPAETRELQRRRKQLVSVWTNRILLSLEAELDIVHWLRCFGLDYRIRMRPGKVQALTEAAIVQHLPRLLTQVGLGYVGPACATAAPALAATPKPASVKGAVSARAVQATGCMSLEAASAVIAKVLVSPKVCGQAPATRHISITYRSPVADEAPAPDRDGRDADLPIPFGSGTVGPL